MHFLWNDSSGSLDEPLLWQAVLRGDLFLRIGFRLEESGDFDGIEEYPLILPLPVAGSLDERNRTRPELSSQEKVSVLPLIDSFSKEFTYALSVSDFSGEDLCDGTI